MKKSILSALLLVFCCALEAGTIVTGKIHSKFDKTAAQELAEFLGKLSGKKWKVVKEGTAVGKGDIIYLGDTAFARKNGIDVKKMPKEYHVVRSVEGGMIVAGAYPIGTLYGSYALLKKCGVRFVAPDETFVPRKKSFRLPRMDLGRTPSFASRMIWDRYPGHLTYVQDAPAKYLTDYHLHRLRTGTSGSQLAREPSHYQDDYMLRTVGAISHTYFYYVPPQKYFKTNPEYFSMDVKGKRFKGQLCLSNQKVWEIALESLRNFIKRDRSGGYHGIGKNRQKLERYPNTYMVSQMDGYNYLCLCPECKKISAVDGDAGLQMRFLNYLAKNIRKEYPEIVIATSAYCSTELPPKVTKAEKNVVIQLADLYTKSDCYRPLTSKFNAKRLQILKDWLKYAPGQIAFYDYWNMGDWYYPPRQEVVIDAVVADLRYLYKNNVKIYFAEFDHAEQICVPFFDMQCYVASELMMDVNSSLEKHISDFILHYYGKKAAPYMTKYLNNIRAGVKKHPNPQFTMSVERWRFSNPKYLYDAYTLLKNAEKAAGKNSRYGIRIREIMVPLLWEIIYFRKENTSYFASKNITMPQLKKECAAFSEEVLRRFEGKKVDAAWKNLKSRLDACFVDIPLDKRFEKYDERDIRVYGYPHCREKGSKGTPLSIAVPDPDSPVGTAICATATSVRTAPHGTFATIPGNPPAYGSRQCRDRSSLWRAWRRSPPHRGWASGRWS